MGAELFHADTHRRTDRHDEANSLFWQFSSEPKSEGIILVGKSQCIRQQLEKPGRKWQNNLFLKMDIYNIHIYYYNNNYNNNLLTATALLSGGSGSVQYTIMKGELRI